MSFLDEDSIKSIFEENNKKSQNDALDKVLNEETVLELEKDNLTNNDDVETIGEMQRPNGTNRQNEKLLKILKELKNGFFDTICNKGHSLHQNEIIELLRHFIQNMVMFSINYSRT